MATRSPEVERLLARSLGVSRAFAAVLANRGLGNPEHARAFLDPSLGALHDPWLLPDVAAAVERIAAAVKTGERILVHGDYDADGVTATALLVRVLRDLGANCAYYVPDRLQEAYGLSRATLVEQARNGVRLIITVDCRPTEPGVIQEAQGLGVGLLVTDHHPVLDGLDDPCPRAAPRAGQFADSAQLQLPSTQSASPLSSVPVVNPMRPDSRYPNRDLSGVGVAFKVGAALAEHFGVPSDEYRDEFLDLVAVGTIADVSPLTGENRALVREGLRLLGRTRNSGLRALADVCRIGALVDAQAVAFRIGPRLNAAGRMGHASEAIELLLTDEEEDAQRIAQSLNELNRERQGEQSRILEDARARIAREVDLSTERAIVLASKDWHVGIVGIAAAKLVDEFNRPAILLSVGDDVARGSARSIPAFNVAQALHECREHLRRYGGHRLAAGLSVDVENLNAFREAFCRLAEGSIADADMAPTLQIDCELTVPEMTTELAEEIARLEPFGPGNPEPILCARDLQVYSCRLVGPTGAHLKLAVGDGERAIDAIGFDLSHLADTVHAHGAIHACFTPQINEWNNARSVQLRLVDIQPA